MENNSWFYKYFKDDILIKDVDHFLTKFKIKKKYDIKLELENIEAKYNEEINNLKKEFSNKEAINKYNNIPSLNILKKEKSIIKLISKYSLKNKQFEKDMFKNALEFLFFLSEILRNRLSQPNLCHENYNIKLSIPRCSYKFCNYKDSCIFNYSESKKICYQDHYVHNMISSDIKVLLKYIDINYSESEYILHTKEILKSINTMSYVISHMENELNSKCMYQPKETWEKFHFTRKVVNSIQKNINI
tara:strand:+ start:1324 stop:2061 length:738 start_codon:yes stop_codon:yes gene_type:complete